MTFNRQQGDSDVNIGINVNTNKQQLAASQRDLTALRQTINDAFAPDNATNQRAVAQLRSQRAEIEANRKAAKDAADTFKIWVDVERELERSNAINDLTADLIKAVKSGKDLDETLEGVKTGLQEIGATRSEIAGVISSTRAATGGGNGAALQTFGREARQAVPAVNIPGSPVSTEGAFRVIEVAGRVQQAFGELSPTMQKTVAGAGALTLGLVALAAGFNAINEQFARQTRAVIDSQEEATRLRLQGSKEEIQAAIDAKAADDEITRARIEENKRLLDAVEGGAGPVGAALADVFNIAGVQELRKETQQLEQELSTNALATGRLSGLLQDEGVQARLTQEALEALRQERQAEIDELARTEVQLRTTYSAIAGGTADAARSRLNSITAENQALNALISEGNLSSDAVTEFAERINELGQEFTIIQELLPELTRIEQLKQAQEDQKEAQEQLIQLTSRAVDIETQGQERINNIREQGLKQVEAAEGRLADARAKLVDFNADAAAKASEINRKFMADDLKRLDDYIVRERRIKRDQRTELLRLAEDEKDALLDAQESNDVAAFIQSKRRFDRQRRETVQDNATEAGDRAEDLTRERAAIATNRDERLQALQVETDKKRADLQAEIVEREAALQEVKNQIQQRVQAEKDAINQSLRNLVNSFDDSTQRMTQRVEQGFTVLAAAGINASNAIIDNFQRRANAFNFPSSATSAYNTAASTTLSSLPGLSGVSFARGTLGVDRPTRAVIGDVPSGYAEAVIPYPKASGLAAELSRMGITGGSTGPNVTVNIDGIAPGVTRAELDAVENRVTQGVYMGIASLRLGQAPGAA
jgi:hypothetical protein